MPDKFKNINPYKAALVLILLLNALLKWRFFCGLVEADDFSYGVYSYTMFRLPLSWDMSMDFRALRLTLLLPVSLLFRILPPADIVAVMYPMAVSFGSIILVYLIGRKLYGLNAGILAAFVFATFPGDILYSTMFLPDIVVPFFLCLSVWTFITAESETGYRTKIWYLMAGFFLFLAFNTRENSYYFLLFFLPFAFNRPRWKRGLYLLGFGFAVPVVILYFIYFIKSGDFLFNLYLAQDYRDSLIESGYIPENSINWISMFYRMFPGFFMKMTGRPIFINTLFGHTFYVGIVCVIYTVLKALKKRDVRLIIAPWWVLIVYLYLEFGTISFSQYQMMKKLDRFLLAMTPAMALAYGVVLSDAVALVSKKVRTFKNVALRWLYCFFALNVMVWLLYTSYDVIRFQKNAREHNMSLFRWGYHDVLEDKPHKPIYGTGGWWFNKLSFFYLPDLRYADMPWRRSEMLRDLKAVTNPEELAESYIILDRRHFSGENDLRIKHSYDDFGSFVRLPPEEWKLLGSKRGVEIYEVPEGWTYVEPDGRELALASLKYSLEIGDIMLFLNNLHPDLISRITNGSMTEEQLMDIFQTLENLKDPWWAVPGDLLEYRKSNGLWKIVLNLDRED